MSGTRVHVLIITALQDELEGVKSIQDGARGGWESRQDSAGFTYHVREFEHASGRVMRVAVARPVDMGPMPASNIATRLVNELDPVCLTMSGICAGRRGDVFLGDVVVASRLFDYEAGKTRVSTNADGTRVEDRFHEITTYNLDPRWQQRAQDWEPEWRNRWQAQRPPTLACQEDWLLDALHRHEQGQGEKPDMLPERKTRCPSWKDVILRLRKRGLLAATGLALTETGRAHVDEQWLLHDGRMPGDPPLRVHVAPMATGSQVVQDHEIFDRLARLNRKLVALDMEGVAIGQVAALQQVRHALVVKAVQDYADHDKDDSLRSFGVRVAAAFVLDFLRENLPADALGPPPPALNDYLSTGRAPLRSVATPATYLVARHQVVPFAGRERELTTLDTWADDGDVVRVLLVHGPAGMGKTRLLTEWLAQRAARHPGEAIGFLTGAHDDAVIDALCTSQRATVVIDYAEERAGLVALLMRLSSLATPEDGGPECVRLVLLARNAGDWWASLKDRSSEMAELLSEPPLELAPLTHAGQGARMAEYRRAHAAFVQALQRRQSSATPAITGDPLVTRVGTEPDLSAEHFQRPLYVHMAALSTALGKPLTGAPRDMLDEILNHEQRYWARYLGIEPEDGKWRQRAVELRQAAAAVVVRGSCAHEDLLPALNALALPDASRICALLQDLYPDPVRAHTWVVAIEPDLVAEALLCSVLERRARPEPWLVNALTGIEPLHWEHAFAVLGRMGVGHDAKMVHIGADAARALLRGDVAGRAEAVFRAALTLTEHTAHSDLGRILAEELERGDHTSVAQALAGRVPQETVSLRELAVWVDRTLLASLGEDGNLEERAKLNNNLGLSYSDLGRQEEALAAKKRAVEFYEELAQRSPDVGLPSLAASLNNLGLSYMDLGRPEEALAAQGRAVEFYEELAQRSPETFLPNLAGSLHNLGVSCSALGRREDALTAAVRAVKIYEKLAQRLPNSFPRYFAASLTTLGVSYSNLGRRGDARVATERAVEIYEELAQRRPDAFLPDLALSLNNLGVRYSDLGRREDALAATERAVKIREELAQRQPDAFLPALAGSLNNLGVRYSELGRREDALAATERAAKIREELAQRWPDAFLPDLALSLNNLGARYSELGRWEDALAATERAVKICKELAQRRPDAFLPDLAMSLHNLGVVYRGQGRGDDALAAMEHAVELRRALTQRWPDAFLPDLAMSLHNLGGVYGEQGRREDALAAMACAVELREELAHRQRDAFLPELAKSLNNLGVVYSVLGRRGEALIATTRAVELYEELAQKHPDAFLPDLATSLAARSQVHSELRNAALALRDVVTGVGHLWPYFERQPAAFAHLMSAMLQIYEKYLDGAEPDELMAERRRRYTELTG